MSTMFIAALFLKFSITADIAEYYEEKNKRYEI